MDEEKFKKLFTDSIPVVNNVQNMKNYLTMSRELLEDYKRYAAKEKQDSIIKFLEELDSSDDEINLKGAIVLLKEQSKNQNKE
jgi:hypothetical protein